MPYKAYHNCNLKEGCIHDDIQACTIPSKLYQGREMDQYIGHTSDYDKLFCVRNTKIPGTKVGASREEREAIHCLESNNNSRTTF